MYPCSIIYEDEFRSELSSSDKAAGRVSLLLQHCGQHTMPIPPILNLLQPWVPSRGWPHSMVELLLLTASSEHLSHCVPWDQQTHFCPPFWRVMTPLSTSLAWTGKCCWKPESSCLMGSILTYTQRRGIEESRTGGLDQTEDKTKWMEGLGHVGCASICWAQHPSQGGLNGRQCLLAILERLGV